MAFSYVRWLPGLMVQADMLTLSLTERLAMKLAVAQFLNTVCKTYLYAKAYPP